MLARVNKKTNKTIGFTLMDQQLIKLVCQFIEMQHEKIAMKKDLNKKEQAIIDTIALTSEISTQRHFKGLFKVIRDLLPKEFGY